MPREFRLPWSVRPRWRSTGTFRHTEAIDVVTAPEGLDRIHERLIGLGYLPRSRGLRKSLRETEHAVNIDVIQTGEHAGSQESPFVYPHPSSDAFVEIDGVRYPTLEKLIEMKLVSGTWGRRLRDLGDVIELIKLNSLGDAFADRLIPEVRAKYAEMMDYVRNERTLD